MENINIVLAANILKYRKKSGLSQEELANKLGVTFQAVSKWELAKSAPDISFLPTMADVFECSIDDLFSYMPKCKREEFNILPGDSVPEGMKNYLSDQIKYQLLNERRADFYKSYDEDGEETDEDVTADYSSEPDKLYSRTVLYNALYAAYDQLTYREQRTLAKHLGFCDSCWSTKKAILKNGEVEYIPIKPMTFEEISHSSSRKSDKASERTFYTALEKMKNYMEENTDYRYIFG